MIHTFPPTAIHPNPADGFRIVIDTGDEANGNVKITSTIPGRADITVGGFGSYLEARAEAHRILLRHLNAPGVAIGGGPVVGSDCLALVYIEREMHRDPAPVLMSQPDSFTHAVAARIAAEHAEFDEREAVLS